MKISYPPKLASPLGCKIQGNAIGIHERIVQVGTHLFQSFDFLRHTQSPPNVALEYSTFWLVPGKRWESIFLSFIPFVNSVQSLSPVKPIFPDSSWILCTSRKFALSTTKLSITTTFSTPLIIRAPHAVAIHQAFHFRSVTIFSLSSQ